MNAAIFMLSVALAIFTYAAGYRVGLRDASVRVINSGNTVIRVCPCAPLPTPVPSAAGEQSTRALLEARTAVPARRGFILPSCCARHGSLVAWADGIHLRAVKSPHPFLATWLRGQTSRAGSPDEGAAAAWSRKARCVSTYFRTDLPAWEQISVIIVPRPHRHKAAPAQVATPPAPLTEREAWGVLSLLGALLLVPLSFLWFVVRR